jgi:metal-dependent amidase/aminoacylase/carboxypeptidase family protein
MWQKDQRHKQADKRSHPMSEEEFPEDKVIGIGGRSSIACYDITAVYRGVSAHAAASPWDGVNALDALVSAYNNISMLRQQLGPNDRIHGAILQAPTVTNAIPELTRTKYTIRSRTMDGAQALGSRVRKCLEAGALATGCTVELEESQIFADLIVNRALCEGFQQCMGDQGERILASDEALLSGSTDQGNVSQIVPALHGLIGIPVRDGARNHTRQFTAAAGTDEAHQLMITAGKAMAMTGCRVLVDDEFYGTVRDAFAKARGDVSMA